MSLRHWSITPHPDEASGSSPFGKGGQEEERNNYFFELSMQRTEKEGVVVKDASKYRVGIVVSDYYRDITDRLLQGAVEVCRAWKVAEENILITRVSGSFEIPYGCLSLLTQEKPDAIVTLGVIVKGETAHDEVIAHAVAQAIMDLTIQYETPISFGVVTTNTLEQAVVRSTGANNKGADATVAALEAVMLRKF